MTVDRVEALGIRRDRLDRLKGTAWKHMRAKEVEGLSDRSEVVFTHLVLKCISTGE